MMADPTSYPVWMSRGDNDQPMLVRDVVGYRVALAQGYSFAALTPPVTHPSSGGVAAGAAIAVRPVLQTSVSPAQPPHPHPDQVR